MKIQNKLTKMLGVDYPIIQGAFGNAGNSDLAIPVSQAGGLGIITSIYYPTPEKFRQDIRYIREKTDKPFAVNFTLWKGKIDNSFHEKYIPVALEEGIKTIFTSGYDGSYVGRIFKDAGCNWIHKCATIRHAKIIVEKGADAVVLVGKEGTGYKNEEQHTAMINITAARRMLNVPIIAAGGFGDARGFVGALAMGASGIYMGTAIMATKEYSAPDKFKMKIVNQDITDPKNTKKVYGMKHGVAPSLASGVIDSIPTIKEFMEKMIKETNEIMAEFKQMGMYEGLSD